MMMARGHPTAYGSIRITENEDHDDSHNAAASLGNRRRAGLSVVGGIIGVVVMMLFIVAIGNHNHNNNGSDHRDQEKALLSLPMLGAAKSHHKSKSTDGVALYFHDQLVDHFDEEKKSKKKKKKSFWTQRYYKSAKHFAGPGHPIFLVLGGEDSMEKLLYPFVNDHLAHEFGAFVLQIEHRFYGESQPVSKPTFKELKKLATPDQAMADFAHLVTHVQKALGCNTKHRSSKHYCPVITVGGSYPGFLSAMMRVLYPDIVDIGYAASAPLLLYSHAVDSNVYYDKVTESAERASAGCPAAIRATLDVVNRQTSMPMKSLASQMGVCVKSIPSYMTSSERFLYEIMYLVPAIFADFNMDNYPPTQDTDLAKACQIFQDNDDSEWKKMEKFFELRGGQKHKCFDLATEIPTGRNATLMTGDWSGAGGGYIGEIWEFQCCKDLIIETGYSDKSMFVPREWSLDWVTRHCQSRFDVTPEPYRMVEKWGFDDLVGLGASRILFTNGLNDGWSVTSHLEDLVPSSIVALNFPNGAHHSDLSHDGPSDKDTDDIKAGYTTIATILGQWLTELKSEAESK